MKKSIKTILFILGLLMLMCIVVQLFAWRYIFTETTYVRKASRTYVFSQAQFIYSLGKSDYFGNWVDRPLFINPTLDIGKPMSELMSDSAFKEMEEMGVNYGLDGFSFFPETTKRFPFFDKAARNKVKNFYLLPEFYPGSNFASKCRIVNKSLTTKAIFKLNNKIVFTSYNADIDIDDFDHWQDDLIKLKKKFGDCFYFLPSIAKPAGRGWNTWDRLYHKNLILSSDVVAIKDYLRKWLRISDGLYFGNVATLIDKNRNFDSNFYKNFLVKIFVDVLSEKEFKGKLLGLSAVLGQENCTRVGYTLSSNGTQTFCESMKIAMDANPDIIIIPEWDEQNENTSLRPTVYNGMTSMRLMRYFTNLQKSKNQQIIKKEDTTLPNILISYRKILTLGEKLSIDLLNVPDYFYHNSYNVKFVLKNEIGEIVFTSSNLSFYGDSLLRRRVEIPSEIFSNCPVLYPTLLITKGEINKQVGKGLQPIYLKSTTNWDYKWVKQDIRDILNCNIVNFSYKKEKDNTLNFDVNLKAAEPLTYVELLEDNQVIYSYSDENNKKNEITIKIAWDAMEPMERGVSLNGSIQLKNAQFATGQIGNNVLGKHSLSIIPNGIKFNSQRASMWKQWAYLSLNKTIAHSEILQIYLPGVFVGEIPVQTLLDNKIYGISGKSGFNLVLSLFDGQDRSPSLVNKDSVSFIRNISPNSSNSIYQLQAIGQSGNIYRSSCLIPHDYDTQMRSITVYSETKKSPIKLNIARNRVPSIIYNFNPRTGSVLSTNGSKGFWGILGGYFSLATGRGGGGAGDDSPFFNSLKNFKQFNLKKIAPDWIKEGNEFALLFDGKGQSLSLPQGVIPRLSAFTIEMDLKPLNVNSKQIILANRSSQYGTISIELRKGRLYLLYYSSAEELKIFNTNLNLMENKWSHFKISYDLKKFTIRINNENSKVFYVTGPSLYDVATSIGGFDNYWFNGEIKNLSVYHFLE